MQASRLLFGAIVFVIAVVAWLARPAGHPAAVPAALLAQQSPDVPGPDAQAPAPPPVLQLDGMAAPEEPVALASAEPPPPPARVQVAAAPLQAQSHAQALGQAQSQAQAQVQVQVQAPLVRTVHRPKHAKAPPPRRVRTASSRQKLVARAQQRRGVIVSVVSNKALWLP